MEKYIEVTGKNEDAAIEKGLAPARSLPGRCLRGGAGARQDRFPWHRQQPRQVKLTYQVPDEPVVEEKAEKPAPAVEPAAPAQAEPAEETFAPAEQAQAKEKPASGEKAEQIERFLTGLMEHHGQRRKPRLHRAGTASMWLVGDNAGALIGRRGETLDAIQQLTNYSVNRGQNKRVRIHLDAENYRAKREKTLERLARKTAGKALKYHRNMTLEPMNAYERHVIHAALQDYEGVTTYSTGSEPNRRVVVACER